MLKRFVSTSLNEIVRDRSKPIFIERALTAAKHWKGRPRPMIVNFVLFTYLFLFAFFVVKVFA